MAERWPPIYDSDDLATCIEQAAGRVGTLGIWEPSRPEKFEPEVCQGDVLQVSRGLPLLGEGLRPRVSIAAYDFWLVLGNTCDFARDKTDVPWTQLVPIHDIKPIDDVEPNVLADFSGYRLSRRFYLPPWPGAANQFRFADFLTPVAASKVEIPEHTTVVARMSRIGWILLHSCLVRFFCRDDGRFD